MMADETVVGIYSPPSGKNTSSVWECFGHPILTFEVSHFVFQYYGQCMFKGNHIVGVIVLFKHMF